MIKMLWFWAAYIPMLLAGTIIIGPFIGLIGGIVGAFEWYMDCLGELKGKRRYPYRSLKNYCETKISRLLAKHQNTFQDNTQRKQMDYAISLEKRKFQNGLLEDPSVIKQIIAISIAFLGFIIFYTMFGIFYKGPLSIFKDGLKYWECKIEKKGN